jgi:hypothetical protein
MAKKRREVPPDPVPSDDELCMKGRCIGPFCPCLCHTSLKLRHGEIRTQVKHARTDRPLPFLS